MDHSVVRDDAGDRGIPQRLQDVDEPIALASRPRNPALRKEASPLGVFPHLLSATCLRYTSSMSLTAKEVAGHVGAKIVGNGDIQIKGVASPARASAEDVVFCEDARMLAAVLASGAGAVIAGEFAASVQTGKTLLLATQPRLAFALAAKEIYRKPKRRGFIHPTAVLADSAKIGNDSTIGVYAIVGENVVIGDGVRIGAGAVIGEGVVIGDDCSIYPRVTIYAGTTLGRGVVVHAGAVLGSDGFGYARDNKTGEYHQMPQIGTLRIGDFVEIGANTTIDRGALEETVIAAGTKIDNLVHVGHNACVGENIVIAAQTGISGSAEIGDGAVIGGQVGIADHVKIEPGVIVGAQSGVPTKKILRGRGQVFWGLPARPIQQYLKEMAVLARLTKRDRAPSGKE